MVGLPLGVGLIAAAVVFVTCAFAGRSPFRIATWDYSDPQLYLDVARHGYSLFRCAPGAAEWCGNAGWFPAYPLLIGAVGRLGIGIALAGLAFAWLFTLGTLVLLWATFLGCELESGAVAALVYAAFAPGMVFGYAMYPLSMLAFFTVAYLWLVTRERWGWAGLAGVVIVLAYPVGLAAPAAVALYVLVCYGCDPVLVRARALALAVGPPVVAVGLLLLQFQLAVGHWNAYFLIQEKYGHQLREPFASIVHALTTLLHPGSFNLRGVSALQTLLVTAVLVSVLVVVACRRPLPRADLLLAFWAVATWLLPSATSHLAGHRGEAALLPVAILVARLPPRLQAGFVAAAVAVSLPTVVLYLRGSLS